MPFATTSPIHPDWQDHHRPTATATLTGKLRVERDGTPGDWDPDTGHTPGGPATPVHEGPYRAQAVDARNSTQRDVAGQQVTIRSYLIQLDADADAIDTGDRVHIIECDKDPDFVDKVLTVTGIVHGTHRFTRDLFCDLDLTNQPEG